MKIEHHDFRFEFPDDWWADAGMADFLPTATAYRTSEAKQICIVSIGDVGPVDDIRRRKLFRDRSSVLKILRGFRLGDAIPPVEVVDGNPGYGHPFKLTHGAHRFYCSIAAGFTHIPAVKGFDISDPFA